MALKIAILIISMITDHIHYRGHDLYK